MNKTHFTSLTNLLPFSVLSKFASRGVFRDELFFFLGERKVCRDEFETKQWIQFI